MADCLVLKSSGGTSSDEVTAKKYDVLKGTKTITSDSNDEVIEGTLENKANTTTATTSSLDTVNSRLRLIIPIKGVYDTASYLFDTFANIASKIGLTAAKLAIGNTILGIVGTYKGLGNATAADVLAGKTFSTTTLSNATGTVVDRGSPTYNLPINGTQNLPVGLVRGGSVKQSLPTKGAATIIPNTANQVIAANQWLSGAQTVQGDPNLKPENIANGVTIFGIKGTNNGFVASQFDIYNRGSFGNGYSISSIVDYNSTYWKSPAAESTAIRCSSVYGGAGTININNLSFKLNKLINLTPYSAINFTISFFGKFAYTTNSGMIGGDLYYYIFNSSGNQISRVKYVSTGFSDVEEERTFSINVSELNIDCYIAIELNFNSARSDSSVGKTTESYIHRLWFS